MTPILHALRSFNFLPLFLTLTLIFRKWVSDESSFPVSIPATWRGVITAAVGSVYGLEMALSNGATFLSALGTAGALAVAGGLADGLLTAVFNHGNAPAWAKLIVMVFDAEAGSAKKFGGGSKGKGHPLVGSEPEPPKAETQVLRAAAPTSDRMRLAMRLTPFVSVLLLVGCCLFLSGCSAFLKSVVPGDLQKNFDCVTTGAIKSEPIEQIEAECLPGQIATIADIILLLAHSADPNVAAKARAILVDAQQKGKLPERFSFQPPVCK